MSKNRLTRRVRRELTANPKKAAILGLLVLVALYFWAPLLGDWIGGSGSRAKPASASKTQKGIPPALARLMSPSLTPGGDAAKKGKKGKKDVSASQPWDRLARWIEQDPKMAPAHDLVHSRDPFHPVAEEVAKNPESAQIEAAKMAVTPETLGLVLSSTLIGPHRRTALINGKAYEQGRTIELASDGQQVQFTLAKVYPRRIVLVRGDKSYELTIPQPALSGRLEVSGSTN